MGDSRLLTADVQKRICAALEIGVPESLAAAAEGVAEATFHSWMAKGEDGQIEPYASFRRAVTRARARAVVNLTKKALAGGPGCSQATWILERRWPRDYSLSTKIQLGGSETPIRIDAKLDELSLEELRALAGQNK